MGFWSTARFLLVALCMAGLVAAGIAAWLAFFKPEPAQDDRETQAFREAATEAGITWRMKFLNNEQGETFKINLYDHGCGLAVGDFDGDGREDIYFCNQLGPNALYRNNGDGTFTEMAHQAGVALGDRVCVAATFVDYLNEGRQSLYVTSTRGGNVLFRNLGNGKFEDVTKAAGLSHVGHSQTAVFFDYDNDGYLDLFLTNTAEWTTDQFDKTTSHWLGQPDFAKFFLSRKEHNRLFHNNRDGTFTDVTEKAGLEGRGWAGDAVAFDYNGDGHMDLFVTSMFGRCQLYRNNGNGTFTDVTLKVLGRTSFGSVGTKILDFNNDGRLDLFVVDMHSDMWMGLDWNHDSLKLVPEAEKKKYPYFGGPKAVGHPQLIEEEKKMGRLMDFRHEELIFGNTLFRNEGGGKFTEVSDRAGLETFWPWGIAVGDFDNDGFEDIFIPSGMGYPFYYWPNQLMMNQGNGTFINQANELGVEPPRRGQFFAQPIGGRPATRSSRCAVVGDFRGIGRLDIVTNNFNDQPYYFQNQLPRKNYIAFRLTGTHSNRDAIGAVVRLYQGKQIMTRQVQAACGYLSQSSRTLHFGLGDHPDVDRVEITWHRGTRQTIRHPAVNRRHDIIEPDHRVAARPMHQRDHEGP